MNDKPYISAEDCELVYRHPDLKSTSFAYCASQDIVLVSFRKIMRLDGFGDAYGANSYPRAVRFGPRRRIFIEVPWLYREVKNPASVAAIRKMESVARQWLSARQNAG